MVIELDGVGFAYDPARPVLRDVSFTVAAGEKLVLLGANGCGKTTLLRILAGLLQPQEGMFRFDGRAVDSRALADRDFAARFRRRVALLFQNPDAMLFNPTVADEIAFGPRQLGRPDVEATVHRWAERFGLARYLDDPPFQLSSGEKKRVCLAALLAVEPEVLLLDEPTANLDPRTTGWLVERLAELQLTIVVATHNLSLAAELGKRALVLDESHALVHDGPVETLLGREEILIAANLVHIHAHRHGEREHRHYHLHEWE